MNNNQPETQQPQPPYRSPWTDVIVQRALAECREHPSEMQKMEVLRVLADRLSAQRDWERYDPRSLSSVTLKRGYRQVARLEGHCGVVRSVHVLPDGGIISGCDAGTVRVWNHKTGSVWSSRTVFEGDGSVRIVRGLPSGRVLVATGGSDNLTTDISVEALYVLVRTRDREWPVDSIINFKQSILCLEPLPDGSVVTGHGNGELLLHQGLSQPVRTEPLIMTGQRAWSVQALPDGRIVTAHRDGKVLIWSHDRTEGWGCIVIGVSRQRLLALHALPDGRIIVGGDDFQISQLVPNEDGDFSILPIGQHDGWIVCLQALPDGRVVSGSLDKKVKIFTPQPSGSWSEEVLVGGGQVRSLQVLPDGRIVCAYSDSTIGIWDGEKV